MKTLPEIEANLRTTTNPSNTMLNTWFKHLLKNNLIFVRVDTREQQPITEDELGLPTRRATLQTGDYMVMVKKHTVRLLFERKSIQDLYGTLFYGRDQFNNEIGRFQESGEFDSFLIMVEGGREDFMEYLAPRRTCKFCKHWTENIGGKKGIGVCSQPRRVRQPSHHNGLVTYKTDVCGRFSDTECRKERENKLNNPKKDSINSLNVRTGVKVIFCGSREEMVEMFEDMIKQYCLQNYKIIVGSD